MVASFAKKVITSPSSHLYRGTCRCSKYFLAHFLTTRSVLYCYPGALLFRLRWYKSLTCPDRIFIERKTHHEGWGQEDSIKERLSIPTNQLNAFMKGDFVPTESSFKASDKDIPAQIALAKDIQRQILSDKKPMVPASRTAYERTAFQLSTSNDVRISLDGNLWLSDEMGRTDTFEDAVVNRLKHGSGAFLVPLYLVVAGCTR